jgi:hypothetical protein
MFQGLCRLEKQFSTHKIGTGGMCTHTHTHTHHNILQSVWCMALDDVNECALGLHDCSAVATCINLKIGYTCECFADYKDGNPNNPGLFIYSGCWMFTFKCHTLLLL